MAYQGNAPAYRSTPTTKDTFSGDGSTTEFTLSKATSATNARVVVANVIQDPNVAYTVSNKTLTFTSAPPSGTDNIYVVHLGPAQAIIGNALSDLTNVSSTAPTDGQALLYSDSTASWAPGTISSGKALYQSVVIEDTGSYTLTAGNSYNIIAFGGGGAGGSAVVGPNIAGTNGAAAAQGGATGAIVQKYVSVSGSDLTLTITIGAGGSGATADTATPLTATGGDGGDTTVTGTGISITAEGGSGGGASQTNSTGTTVTVAAMSTRASGSGGDQTTEGKIVGSVSSDQGYSSVNVGASFGGDVADVSNYIELSNNNAETVAGEDGIVPFAIFSEQSGSSGLQGSSINNLDVTAGAGGFGCGGGAQICRSRDTSSTNHQATGGDGGQGFVIINEYKELT